MARYVVANRRSGKFTDSEKFAARSALDKAVAAVAGNLQVVGGNTPQQETDRRILVVDTDPQTAAAMKADPDVLVEPEIVHWPQTTWPADFLQASRAALAAPVQPGAAALTVEVVGSGTPLVGAQVLLFLRGPGRLERSLEQTTDATGEVKFSFPPVFTPAALLVIPAGNFWTMVVRGPSGAVRVDCLHLPQTGPLGWWHWALGQDAFAPDAGQGIRVGVVDTGVGPHPCLDHVTDIGSFIDGFRNLLGGQDVDSHGTHVCGTIGARPLSPGQFAGIAPGASLFSARVFPPNRGANQGDIADAIDELSRSRQVDLINLSLGAPVPSEIERDAIRDALERGTLCICAAANSGGPVEYPAAFDESVAVSALGRLGFAPTGTLSATRLPLDSARFGDDNLYLANFSCFGPEIDAAGPGVAVIAPVPERFGLATPYAALDGTSMASPSVCGALAVLLSQSPNYLALPRDLTRSQMARKILRQRCRDIGLAPVFQGRGVPVVS